MNGKKILAILICMISFSAVSAEITGKMIGGEPVMRWEDGGIDFFVMFNSNIDDQITLLHDDPDNPQGDTCLNESVFTLTDFHIPEDAIIDWAYLIWMGAVDPEKLDEPTDNSVKLKFIQTADSEPVVYEETITAGETGKLLLDENSFEFESLYFQDDVKNGCSESEAGQIIKGQYLGYFTYRVDITGFFNKIYEMNSEAGKDEYETYFGTYVFSDLDCTEHDFYRCKTTMVSSWAVFLVYYSKNIRPKRVYFYNGLSFVHGDKSVAEVTGFKLPESPVVHITTMIAEGDPKLVDGNLPPEGILLQGEGSASKFRLNNICNPIMGTYVEVFNSVSSVANWNPDTVESDKIQCVSGVDGTGINFGIDVDSFILDSASHENLQEQLKKGDTEMKIEFSVNQDEIFTNFMVISTDYKFMGTDFDIPVEASDTTKSRFNFPYDREKHFCACPSNDYGNEPDYYCETVNSAREFYYFIKVQNWGNEDAENVVVTDELDQQLEYIPGTTEMATHYVAEMDVYDDWTVIPDKADGVFPLSGDGYKVSSKMMSCDKSDWTCTDTVLIRYKVRPKAGTEKYYVFENTAQIKDGESEFAYKTNMSYPLKLKPTRCVIDTDCPSPTPQMCGGSNCLGCNDDDPVPDSDDSVNDDSDAVDVDKLNDEESTDTDKSSDGCGCSLID